MAGLIPAIPIGSEALRSQARMPAHKAGHDQGEAAMSQQRQSWTARLVVILPYAWLARFLPGAVSDRAEDQPVADRAGAAALSAGFRSRCRLQGIEGFFRCPLARQLPAAGLRQPLSRLVSAQPDDRGVLDTDAAACGLSHCLCAGAHAAPLAVGAGGAGHPAVLDLVPHPRLCLDERSCSARAC